MSAFRSAQTVAKTTEQRVFATYDETTLRFLKENQPNVTVTMRNGIRMVPPQRASTIAVLESGQIIGPDAIELVNRRGRRIQLSIDHATGLVKLVNPKGREQ